MLSIDSWWRGTRTHKTNGTVKTLPKTNFSIHRKEKEILLLLVVTVLCVILLEAVFRFTHPLPEIHPYGWYPPENSSIFEFIHDHPGVDRNVTVTYYDNGFKRWGNPRTNKTKILVIGDSFTEMKFTNNGEEWYAQLEQAFPQTEFFVFGAGGYGTLQEYFIIFDYFDEIHPDIIIWQMYFNDFINDVFIFDRQEYPLNNHGYRPYLEEGTIVYRYPAPLSSLRGFATISTALNWYDNRQWNALMQNSTKKDLFYHKIYGERFWEKEFTESRIWQGRFSDAYDTSLAVVLKGKEKAGNTPIFLFSGDDKLEASIEQLSEDAGLLFIPGISEALNQQEALGIPV
ncbi:MAG: SGNH/GDSL hydrolase family protein, partial [Nanoarchaeota archaeon]